MKAYSLNNKKFVTTRNEKGLSSTETIFTYFQHNEVITGNYKGGRIKEGTQVGKQTAPDEIQLLFQCITMDNELKAGESKGKITEDSNGNLLLRFEWNWLTGDKSGGYSSYKEVK